MVVFLFRLLIVFLTNLHPPPVFPFLLFGCCIRYSGGGSIQAIFFILFFWFKIYLFNMLMWNGFLIFSSDEYSLKRATELLFDVARRGEESGLGVPCLFIAAKDDLDSYPMAIKDSTAVLTSFSSSIFFACWTPSAVPIKTNKQMCVLLVLWNILWENYSDYRLQFAMVCLRFVRVWE